MQRMRIGAAALLGLSALAPAAMAQDTNSAPAGATNAAPIKPWTDLQASKVCEEMLSALAANDHAKFISNGDPTFQQALKPAMLEKPSRELAPRMKTGYRTLFVAKLNQRGFTIFLWKLEFEDGGDDQIVRMAVRGNLVSGFLVQ